MRYVVTHPRRVRGESVHQTSWEKKLLLSKEREEIQVKVQSQTAARDPETLRKEIEEAFLMPEVEHFVETPEVRETEARMKLWLDAGYPVHLIGPTGCGKTSLAMHVARQFGRPVVWINGDESITTADLIGGYSQIENESVRDKYIHNVFKSKDVMKVEWVDNPLSLACKYGYTLIYNEFSRTKPAANNVFLSVFEEGVLELPTKFGEDRYIRVHPEFRAILTSNSIEYAGIHRPQDALLDRMVGIYTDYYGYETELRIVMEHTGLEEDVARRVVEIVRYLRDRLPDAQKPGTRACIMIGKGLKMLNRSSGIGLDQICIDVIANKTSSKKEMEEKRELVCEAIAAVQEGSGG
ncbi:MAG: gas vesicle protein GvpN [Methanothrix sp.]|uniref:Gas vesicle protein GvpN n=1 Tax=Methanothrix thermoacetophila (strain DSM 6194 / JCM 14653 / NBRC 101360 / PT) TaxID=349307 RepID=A0B586_METTP|nr:MULTISPECIES: gas vesicle protein GvpN [Methanothrix]ABK13860.1 gas vesicle protein GvpN [Methanothrix thermoacetophila PT]MBC7079964.1 gas vesicle protein GvpN [Methanothrix sp.]NPU88113.1 gas vesicle protein GvpN [Methanothrix sp.]